MRLPPVKDSMPVEAAGEKFTLPVVTRAAAAAGAAEMANVVASLLRLCSDEPVTAVVAVADALSKRHPTKCVGSSRSVRVLGGGALPEQVQVPLWFDLFTVSPPQGCNHAHVAVSSTSGV